MLVFSRLMSESAKRIEILLRTRLTPHKLLRAKQTMMCLNGIGKRFQSGVGSLRLVGSSLNSIRSECVLRSVLRISRHTADSVKTHDLLRFEMCPFNIFKNTAMIFRKPRKEKKRGQIEKSTNETSSSSLFDTYVAIRKKTESTS